MLGSRTDLHIFDAGSVNGTRYYKEILLPYVRLFRGAMGLQFLFMDDNAPCHRTVAAEQLLESEDTERLDLPVRSPDVNPIEHVWDFLGRRLAACTLPPVMIRELRLALQDEWAAMPQQLIDTLILSMGRCCESCLAVRGDISATKDRTFLAGHPSQGCFGLQSHCAPCYFFNQASFYPSNFSFRRTFRLPLTSGAIHLLLQRKFRVVLVVMVKNPWLASHELTAWASKGSPCLCPKCKSILREHGSSLSRIRLNSYKAICNPSYICQVTDDPILYSFLLDSEMNKSARMDKEFKNNLIQSASKLGLEESFLFQQDNDPKHTARVVREWLLYNVRKQTDYAELREQVRSFTVELINQCRNTDEVELLLKLPGGFDFDTQKTEFPRLQIALDYKQKEIPEGPEFANMVTNDAKLVAKVAKLAAKLVAKMMPTWLNCQDFAKFSLKSPL
ncbi:transposable element Tcb2 transposase [Trichonephila clavipes]|nr:transposable element Tcb2 transposase [Trichonephila clavipes]